MCDPTILSVASLAAGAAGTLATSMGASAAANKQKQDYEQWAQQQHANRVQAALKDEQDRQQAEASRQQGLQAVSPQSQTTQQQAEQARLTQYLQGQGPAASATGVAPTSVTDLRLSGQQNITDPTIKADLASKLNQASAAAKQRIAALAGVSSYGGSSGGLDQLTSRAFQTSGQGIDLANEMRRGDLGVLGTQQAVNPIQTTYQPSPFASMSGDLLKFGAQGVGRSLAPGGST